jgi:sugar lactone lactonase YvrE
MMPDGSTQRGKKIIGVAVLFLLCLPGALAGGGRRAEKTAPPAPPALLLEGGRRLEFVRAFSSERELKTKRSWLSRVVDFVVGPPDLHSLVRPYGITTDSQNRIIVTDPGARAVHVFDFAKRKYHRMEGGKEEFKSPIGVAVDDEDNIYVSDSELGKIFVFDARGRFRRYLGDVKGEGYFKRPTGLAVDAAAKRLYVTDTLKHAIYTLDLDGHILGRFGQRGQADGEFNFPTEIAVRNGELIVVDAMNFRVQIFDRSGAFRAKFGKPGDVTGYMFRTKGLSVDSEGDFYLADAYFGCVQVFNRSGELLYYFGQPTAGALPLGMPAGVHIDGNDFVYVVDSYNRRVQVFRYVAAPASLRVGGTP